MIGNFTISPELRATLVITLINEIRVRDLDNDQHNLSLFFLRFPQALLDNLQRLTPTLVNVSARLSTAQVYLNLASVTERTRSEANKTPLMQKGRNFYSPRNVMG